MNQSDLVKVLKDLNILPVAYCPMARVKPPGSTLDDRDGKTPNVHEEPLLLELAAKYGKKPSQIILNWHLKRGCAVIPKASSHENQLNNISIYEFDIEEEDVEKINKLNMNIRIFNTSTSFKNYEVFA